ncbi:MAG: hypothetical protein JWS10_3208 [Cypionkella sp.]|nr:hypothetical protein [Cypionkella sp.]
MAALSYIICGTPRSGSTMLCDMLTATGVAGAPDSFFMSEVDPVWAAVWGLPSRGGSSREVYAASYLRAAIKAGTGETAVFGLRLMQKDLADLLRMIAVVYLSEPSDAARLRAAFGEVRYIHLSREDKLAQAVS